MELLIFFPVNFQKRLDAVARWTADLALIPVENNIAGRVADMHFF